MKEFLVFSVIIIAVLLSGGLARGDSISDEWQEVYDAAMEQCLEGSRHVKGTKGVQYWDCDKVAREKATAVIRARYS